MRIINLWTGPQVEAMGLTVPAPLPGEAAPEHPEYHIIEVMDTQETFVLPAHRVKIVTAANLGDRYEGLNLDDPAFRRRFSGGFVELPPFKPEELEQILARFTGWPTTAKLIKATVKVHQEVTALQLRDESLLMGTNLAILKGWVREVMRRHADKVAVAQAFVEAAEDLWVDMIVPLKGVSKDPAVTNQVLNILNANKPSGLL
jgi:hypothetical protein